MRLNRPKRDLPDSQKDAKWHKEWSDYHLGSSTMGVSRQARAIRAYKYYHGDVDAADHTYLTISDAGVEYPIDFVNYNTILMLIEQVVSESSARGFELTVNAASDSAISRKRDGQLDLRVDFKLMDLYEREQEQYGMPMIREDMAFDEEELKEKEENYKEEGEKILQRVLDNYVKKNQWKFLRDTLLEDALVAGACFMGSVFEKNGPRPKMYDPNTVVFDESAKDAFLSDASFIGTIEYVSISEVLSSYELSDEDRKRVFKIAENGGSVNIGGSHYPQYKSDTGTDQILVTRIEFKDIKKKEGLHFQNNGISHFHIKNLEITNQDRKERFSEGRRAKAVSRDRVDVEIVRTCTVIGGEIVAEYGELENQVRTADDWQKTGFSIKAFLPRWKFGRNVSTAELLIPLQQLKDQCLYQIRRAFKKDIGRFFLNDVSQTPENFDTEVQMHYAAVLGVVPINSRMTGVNANYNQFQTVDMTLPETTRIYIEIANYVESQMEKIAGIPPIRQGRVEAASQAVGVTEISQQQSMLRTERLFSAFEVFTENFFNMVLGQYKLYYATNPEKYSHIIGDDGVEFLRRDTDFALDDYGTYISTSFVSGEDKKTIKDMTSFAVQNGQIDFLNGMYVMLEDNPREAFQKIKKFMDGQKEEQRQAQQIEQSQQLQAQQTQMQMADQQNQLKLETEREKAEGLNRGIAAKNRNNLILENMRSKDRRLATASKNTAGR